VAPAWLPVRPLQRSLHHPVAREHEHCKRHGTGASLPPARSARHAVVLCGRAQ
jgi:hypothetical protein